MDTFIGTSGWNYKHWKGNFYPEEISQKGWLKYYCEYFGTVEINSTFYRWQKESTIKKWKIETPERFIFTVKAPRTITHIKKLVNIKDQIKDFYNLLSNLENKIGCILFQLPPSFDYNEKNFTKIKDLAAVIDNKKTNVIEFREKNWWNKNVFDFLKNNNLVFCSVSGNGMPENIIADGKVVYIRFHSGEENGNYSDEQLKFYAGKIRKINKPVYVYFNNDAKAYAIKNALQLGRLLKTN